MRLAVPLGTLCLAVAAGILAAIPPARQPAKLNILAALQYE
jgi:ABC-type lipoprotein release transport system permease subunit